MPLALTFSTMQSTLIPNNYVIATLSDEIIETSDDEAIISTPPQENTMEMVASILGVPADRVLELANRVKRLFEEEEQQRQNQERFDCIPSEILKQIALGLTDYRDYCSFRLCSRRVYHSLKQLERIEEHTFQMVPLDFRTILVPHYDMEKLADCSKVSSLLYKH